MKTCLYNLLSVIFLITAVNIAKKHSSAYASEDTDSDVSINSTYEESIDDWTLIAIIPKADYDDDYNEPIECEDSLEDNSDNKTENDGLFTSLPTEESEVGPVEVFSIGPRTNGKNEESAETLKIAPHGGGDKDEESVESFNATPDEEDEDDDDDCVDSYKDAPDAQDEDDDGWVTYKAIPNAHGDDSAEIYVAAPDVQDEDEDSMETFKTTPNAQDEDEEDEEENEDKEDEEQPKGESEEHSATYAFFIH